MGHYLSAPLIAVNSDALTHLISPALCNAGMRTVEETRRLRLAQLVQEKGSYVALNGLLGMSARDSTLSQIANASRGSKTGQPKTMGSPMARKLETVCGKPVGWMDRDPECDAAAWPFDGRVDLASVNHLPPELLSEAVGALNEVLRRAQALSGKRDNAAA